LTTACLLALAALLPLPSSLPALSQAPPPAPAPAPAVPPDPVAQLLRARLERAAVPPAVRLHGERAQAWSALGTFYARRGYLPAWWDRGTPRPAAQRLLGALDAVAADGLEPRLYPVQELRRGIAAMSSASASPAADRLAAEADLELALSYTFLATAAHLSIGRIQPPEMVHVGWYAEPARADLAAALERALGPDQDVAGVLAGIAPRAAAYVRLRQALARYRDLAAHGGWPPVPAGSRLRLGDHGARVAALAARLAASGELPPGAAAAAQSGSFDDEALAAALARFQETHGLAATRLAATGKTAIGKAATDPPATGKAAVGKAATGVAAASIVVDAATLAALAVPIADRIRQIELNLERWRWTGDPGSRYVLVNIPGFELGVIEDGNVVLRMKVIVGRAHRKTPVFSDLLTQVVLNPPWNIPDSIAAGEIVPDLLRDPGYLRRKGYEIRRRDGGGPAALGDLGEAGIRQLGKRGSPYRLVQPPGADNALGRYKFVFPNQFDVYLHDTPTGRLFARSKRDFSHGCIRLEKPAALAAWLLDGDPRWTPQAVEAGLAGGRTITIPLRRPLPVHILYKTAWVDRDGTLEFRPDVYRHDAWLAAALAAETPLWDDLVPLRRLPALPTSVRPPATRLGGAGGRGGR
jgi:L,D-transpeptidase YcbB